MSKERFEYYTFPSDSGGNSLAKPSKMDTKLASDIPEAVVNQNPQLDKKRSILKKLVAFLKNSA